jgi:hypothetical protein
MKVRSHLDLDGVARIINVLDGIGPQDAATVAQLTAAIEGLAWKDSARVAATTNINLAAPGTAIDGITLAVNDRVLLTGQTAPADNGIYIWNGAAVTMTRAADASTAVELEGAAVTVEEGTSANSTYRQTSVNFVLGTGAVTFASFGTSTPPASETTAGVAQVSTQAKVDAGTDDLAFVTALKLATWAGRVKKLSANIGDGAATQYDITHNFNSRDVLVEVVRNSTPWDTIICDISRPDVNTVRLNFSTAPTAALFRVIIRS